MSREHTCSCGQWPFEKYHRLTRGEEDRTHLSTRSAGKKSLRQSPFHCQRKMQGNYPSVAKACTSRRLFCRPIVWSKANKWRIKKPKSPVLLWFCQSFIGYRASFVPKGFGLL